MQCEIAMGQHLVLLNANTNTSDMTFDAKSQWSRYNVIRLWTNVYFVNAICKYEQDDKRCTKYLNVDVRCKEKTHGQKESFAPSNT